MTATNEVLPSTGPSRARSARRPRWMPFFGVGLVFVIGVGTGALLPESTVDLNRANSQLDSLENQRDLLESERVAADEKLVATEEELVVTEEELVAAEEDDTDLTGSVGRLEATAVSAAAEGRAAARRLDAREAVLNERAEALDQRETELDTRAAELAADRETGPSLEPSADGEAGTTSVDFDRAYAVDIASDIAEDIKSVDERLADGIAVSSALSLLSDSYARLLDAGIPEGVVASQYSARLTTLTTFAADAADLNEIDPTDGRAKYAVIRQETGALFAALNTATGTSFQLP